MATSRTGTASHKRFRRAVLNRDRRAGVIAHEAAHAARFILDAIGETTRTDEIEPYLIGDITAATWRMIHQEP